MAATAGISRSGRVRKKSAKLKEMEDLDIPEFEANVKSRKKSSSKMDDYDDIMDEKKVAPIKIPKISFSLSSPTKKKVIETHHTMRKITPFPSPTKPRLEPSVPLFQESSPDISKASASSSASSESSSSSSSSTSSSDESDIEHADVDPELSDVEVKQVGRLSSQEEKTVVDPYRQFNSPDSYVEQNSDLAVYGSEGEASESALIIAEESNDHSVLGAKMKKDSKVKKPQKVSVLKGILPHEKVVRRKKVQKRKPLTKNTKATGKKIDKPKTRPMTAYMLWCRENRKRVVVQNPDLDFSSISKKMGEIWQSLPDNEKMVWRKKAKKNSTTKGSAIISTGRSLDESHKFLNSSLNLNDDVSHGSLHDGNRTVGTTPIDVAAHLKLLGESLSIIGQRLTEHEGQIAVSGSLSVLLDSTLVALGPLICLTSEIQELNGCSQDTLSQILDNIAYIMPGV